MTILEWLVLIFGVIVVAPVLAYLCVKWGMVGFYRGKEAFRKTNEFYKDVNKEPKN